MLEKRWSSISSRRSSNCLDVSTLAGPLIMQSWTPLVVSKGEFRCRAACLSISKVQSRMRIIQQTDDMFSSVSLPLLSISSGTLDPEQCVSSSGVDKILLMVAVGPCPVSYSKAPSVKLTNGFAQGRAFSRRGSPEVAR